MKLELRVGSVQCYYREYDDAVWECTMVWGMTCDLLCVMSRKQYSTHLHEGYATATELELREGSMRCYRCECDAGVVE